MAKMQANQMRAGMVIEFEGQRWTILRQNIMIPGKGNAIIQVDMRNIKTGSKKDQRWRTADTVERLQTEDKEFTFSYAEGENLVLMDPETYEQTTVSKEILGDRRPRLRECEFAASRAIDPQRGERRLAQVVVENAHWRAADDIDRALHRKGRHGCSAG